MPRLKPMTEGAAKALLNVFPLSTFKEIEDSRKNGVKHTFFPYIQKDHSAFITGVLNKIGGSGKFVDIGCGAGDKLLLTHIVKPSLNITGVEIDAAYAAAARKICPFAKIIEGNALTMTWEKYDFLYSYTPISDRILWATLLNRIMLTMKRGAKLLVYDIHYNTHFNWDPPGKNRDYNDPQIYTRR